MPYDLESKADDALVIDADSPDYIVPSGEAALDLDNQGAAFMKKFVVAMNCAKDTGDEMTREAFDAFRAEYVELGATERYAILSCLSGTFAQFAHFERDDYDAFVDADFAEV